MDADRLSTLIIVLFFLVFFAFAWARELYLEWEDDRALQEYYDRIREDMNR